MCEVERNHYSAFLSSVGSELREVRAAIHDLRQDRAVWVAENCRKDIDGIDDRYASANELIWRNSVCLAGVRKSDALIWLLVSRDGYSKFAGSALRVSLIEAEIMQAVFDMKPIHVVRISTKESQTGADESVDGLFSLLKKSYPLIKETNFRNVFNLETGREELLSHVDSVLQRLTPLAGMTGQLLKFRLRAGIRSRLPHSRKLVEASPVGRATIPLKHIEETLREAESRKHDYSYRLALLWVVKRNLQSWIDSEEDSRAGHVLFVRWANC